MRSLSMAVFDNVLWKLKQLLLSTLDWVSHFFSVKVCTSLYRCPDWVPQGFALFTHARTHARVCVCVRARAHAHTHTHTRLMALCPGLPRWAGTRKVKPIWILLKQETVSGSGISWAICKSARRSRETTTPTPHHSVFYRPDTLPATQPTASKHWRCNFALFIGAKCGTCYCKQLIGTQLAHMYR